MNARFSLSAFALAILFARCSCEENIQPIKPVLAVSPSTLDFGKVKVGEVAERMITLSSHSQAAVSIDGATLSDDTAPGGAAAFELEGVPRTVSGLRSATFKARFRPTAREAYGARLALASSDPDRPTIDVKISGEGAHPILQVTAECLRSKRCEGTVVSEPLSIDFGEEPLDAVPIPTLDLPTVTLLNIGDVPLALTKIALQGPHASAFTVEVKDRLPSGQQALFLDPGKGVTLPIRFKPFAGISAFAAELVIQSDDPMHAEVRVALAGTLEANQPPRICANITAVQNPDVSVVRYDSPAHWAPLLTPPPGGYVFSAEVRDIQPRATVFLSALSNPSDTSTCTSDPEDQRVGLVYAWSVTGFPEGVTVAPPLRDASSPTATLSPIATGEYEVSLRVSDRQGHFSATTIKFVAVLKRDLVVQLSWGDQPAASANVDLDLHLVRPSSAANSTDPSDPFSGVFSFFGEGPFSDTSGDVNGFSDQYRRANPGLPLGFNWGDDGLADDPTLNVDDVGGGPFIETISLNAPQHDTACETRPCAYKVLVHYFGDKRISSSAPSCEVSGCLDGDPCNCSGAGERCVATSAPPRMSASGTGKCHIAPKPVVRVFLKANPVPAAVIPVATQELFMGAPCQMLYVADVVWPAKNAGGTANPEVVARSPDSDHMLRTRFGVRGHSSLTCTPNTPTGVVPWYIEDPL
jgi:hypothetical protein